MQETGDERNIYDTIKKTDLVPDNKKQRKEVKRSLLRIRKTERKK